MSNLRLTDGHLDTLAGLSSVTNISLADMDLSTAAAAGFAGSPSLKGMMLINMDVSPALFADMMGNPGLLYVSFNQMTLTDEMVAATPTIAATNLMIADLSMEVEQFDALLRKLPGLTSFYFSDYSRDEVDRLAPRAASLRLLPNLAAVTYSARNASDEVIEDLAKLDGLREISVSIRDLTLSQVRPLVGMPSLQKMRLSKPVFSINELKSLLAGRWSDAKITESKHGMITAERVP